MWSMLLHIVGAILALTRKRPQQVLLGLSNIQNLTARVQSAITSTYEDERWNPPAWLHKMAG